MKRVGQAFLLASLLLTLIAARAFAIGECYQLRSSADLLLRPLQQSAKVSGSVECVASNGVTNFEGSFSGNVRLHQVNPSIDYESPFSAQGEWVGSVEGPANYAARTCYQGFVSVSSGTTNGSGESSEQCTPEPPTGPPCTSCGCDGSGCEQSPTCPVILDLNGDGIHTTSITDAVSFWTDPDGEVEPIAWTDPRTEEGFLWIDLNEDHVAQVSELFGSRMVAPGGGLYVNGYEALTSYDSEAKGGDGDGSITHRDRVWARLKLWVDRNHDGISQPAEISVLSAHNIVSLDLRRTRGHLTDLNGNELYLVSGYDVRTHGNDTERRLMADIEFREAGYD